MRVMLGNVVPMRRRASPCGVNEAKAIVILHLGSVIGELVIGDRGGLAILGGASDSRGASDSSDSSRARGQKILNLKS